MTTTQMQSAFNWWANFDKQLYLRILELRTNNITRCEMPENGLKSGNVKTSRYERSSVFNFTDSLEDIMERSEKTLNEIEAGINNLKTMING